MNFNQIVLEAMEEKWVLIWKETTNEEEYEDSVYQFKPVSQMTKEEKDAIKKMHSNPHSKNRYEGYDVLGWPYVTIIIDKKSELEEYIKENKKSYGNLMKRELNVDPETKQSWEDIANEL